MNPKVLYLSRDGQSPSHLAKLAGIRRYCSTLGWEAEPVIRPEFTGGELADILGRHCPVGCVVDGVSRRVRLPPRLFGKIPVSYIGYPRGRTGNRPNFHFDTAEIAKTAFRELSAGMPECYAAVGQPQNLPWSRQRVAAFRAIVHAVGAECHTFQRRMRPIAEKREAFAKRLAAWIAGLPEHCAVFAVSDSVAVLVERAARSAMRNIPRSLTLVSVDNFKEICESADPPISSIQLDFERMGFLAAAALGKTVSYGGIVLVGPLLAVRRHSTGGRGRHEPWILDAVEMIRREACDGLSAADLAAHFPFTRRLFDMRFREAVGRSPLDEILHVRLEKAQALLSGTDAPVMALPDFCGFSSYRALDNLFRTRYGIGMLEWRRRNSR